MTAPQTTDAKPRSKANGALGFGGCLLVVLALLLLGGRGEITQSWGLAGEPGTFEATSCRSHLQGDGSETRVICEGTFTPDSGDPASAGTLYHNGDAGETYDVRADDGTSYRTDWAARWSAVALPLIPLGLLLLVPGIWLALRHEGPLSRRQKHAFLWFSLVPAGAVVLLGGAGFLVALFTT